jgi:hypothetical protein
MNELVTEERGILVPYTSTTRQKLSALYQFSDQHLELAIETALALNKHELRSISEAARTWFIENKRHFSGRIARALTET